MKLAAVIAIRYLLSKKSHNAINAITLVACCGIAIITAALIVMLSVYNGFESLVNNLCSNFDPELRIETRYGKTFTDSEELRSKIASVDAVADISAILEENILLSYGSHQIPAKMLGVDDAFALTTAIDSIVVAGEYKLKDDVADYCVLGAGIAAQLGAGSSFVRPITAYCPIRSGKVNLLNPEEAFTEGFIYCSGIFLVNQAEYDDNICITSLTFAQAMLNDSTQVSAYQIRINDPKNIGTAKQNLEKILGQDFIIKTRYQQQEESYRIMQIEKWITFLIVIFILLIASFNLIGSLSMLIIDKEEEIATLHNLGANNSLIRKIFAIEGLLISGVGAMAGIIIGVVLCLIQEHFEVIGLGGNSNAYIIDAYPVVLQWTDVLWSAISVFVIGILATIYPIRVLRTQSHT